MLLEFEDAAPVLQAIGMAESRRDDLDVDALAVELGASPDTVREHLDALDHAGLLSRGAPEDDLPPRLTRAGRQYLAAKGDGVRDDALSFLPHHIDDLHARDALLAGGAEIVNEFREALLDDAGVTYAETLVPPAFQAALDDKLALNLFAAAVALNARLAVEEPAACVGEELIAVAMISRAKWLLSARARADAADDPLTHEEADEAKAHFNGVFELFQDDDVLNLFKMDEPADAAVDGHSWLSSQMGVVDQRVEAWFRPFGWATAAGYLEPSEARDEAHDA